jgi:DNA invertase Pin-like site-specific DNA recombinase
MNMSEEKPTETVETLKARIAELDKTRSLTLKTNWMTVNEIRQMAGLERLPGADVVLGLSKLQNGTLQNISSATSKRKLELERKFGKLVDKLLADRIAAGKSVNKICRELGIGKQTFYSWAEEYQLKR